MFGLRRRKDGVLYGVLIDIGSGSVGVAIVLSDANVKQPEILFNHRVFMRATKRAPAPIERIRRIREALFSASLILSKDGLAAIRERDPDGLPDHILITCTAPWSQVLARNIHYTQDTPTTVTPQLLKDLLGSAEAELVSEDDNDPTTAAGSTVVERATVDIRINGYEVKSPIGLSGTEIELSHVTGLIPAELLAAISEVRDKLFPRAELHAHTSMLVTFAVLRDVMPNLGTFGIIDVSAEATELGVVSDGILLHVTHAPMGSNTLQRSLIETAGKTSGDASALLTAYGEGQLSHEAQSEIEPCVIEYRTALKTVIEALPNTIVLPETLVVTAHSPLQRFFTQTVDRALSELHPSKRTVISLSTDILEVNASQGLKKDVYLALGSRFFHKQHRSGNFDTV